jgi:hypothetical protein
MRCCSRLSSSVFVLLAACRAPAPGGEASLLAAREAEVARLEAARADLARRVELPLRIAHPTEGTLLVTRARLDGPLGDEALRLRFTYLNSTAETFDEVDLTVTVRDAFGRERSRATYPCIAPAFYSFTPGSTYTDELSVPTRGAHLDGGFTFDVEMARFEW